MHIYNQCPYQVSTSYTLRFMRYSPDKIFKLKVTTTRSKVKSRSHHDVAHLHHLNQCPYQVSTSYTLRFLRYSPDKLFPTIKLCSIFLRITVHTYLWAGSGMRSLSENSLCRKSCTSSRVSGPPMFNIRIPVFGCSL